MPESTYITIEGGKIKEKTKFSKWLWEHEDGRYEVKTTSKKIRTIQSNKYYWGVICPIVLECLRDAGYNEIKSTADVHEILKYKFLRKQIPNDQGEYIEFLGSTANLTRKEFGEYMEAVCQWVAENWNISVPGPGTQSAISY